jgi:glycerophosphoryl diester phosphodiesterase
MQIISHRGYWKDSSEKNTAVAFERSFSLLFGTETDVRDYRGNLVISHDMAGSDCLGAEDFFTIYNHYNHRPLTLALNVKADGLQLLLHQLIEAYHIHDYFVFDMSVPDTIGYIKQGIRFYSRQSEYEAQPVFYDECAGIWLDAFHHTWYSGKIILEHLAKNKQVAVVSPELHKRDPLPLWELLKKEGLHQEEDVLLCTDIPEEAIVFFQ